MFPNTRLRRKRLYGWLRNLLQENSLSTNDLILPLFVHDEDKDFIPIKGLNEIKRHSILQIIDIVKQAKNLGINAIALFPVVNNQLKCEEAQEAYNPNNLICNTIKAIKDAVPNIGIIADVALDPYTPSGHDGILINNKVDNDLTISILCKQAVVLAAAGCDIVAPSDMMDGRIKAIREFLDNCTFQDVCILSYAAKYCSGFYNPFRYAIGSHNISQIIDKSTYQINIANANEALTEIQMDIDESADMIMIKPGMPYLDIIKSASNLFKVPIFAYQVSGEYAMIKAAAQNGWLDYDQVIYESLISFKRAGAKSIITYAALELADIINT
ncbi:porphobilinogen synthase [Neoehrlichia mikurensis]|uniref:Delta-aminolevulinic acid dehydratase n=1 Tax=Neoehrlichia mikurensis TaxID=89586 RepID=A0A9Q9BSF1_9RICK|nr:porphobilinogen synthase [Neoehrlichia mikurensis]QXK92095.1 porphobilinogen synthase [Neoehrlichia mikurensis]QXK92552.1 porphobilinogen synthase [Neoehrlichia mikurensis]QXK93788.1 porphobilinogen synthase [Neoehrlichia mikurensis]UTO55237.1 porphobilinogen synthase [Neoehrlichia mikurensis]UTO56157.1 porphobilinogen synthase [Neoehrlichia mikurensis]